MAIKAPKSVIYNRSLKDENYKNHNTNIHFSIILSATAYKHKYT